VRFGTLLKATRETPRLGASGGPALNHRCRVPPTATIAKPPFGWADATNNPYEEPELPVLP